MNGSRLPCTNRETGPCVWLRITLWSIPAESTGQVSTSVNPWLALQRIGYQTFESSHTRTPALFHQ